MILQSLNQLNPRHIITQSPNIPNRVHSDSWSRLSAVTSPQQPQDSNANSSRPNQIIKKQKEKYIEYWKETTKTQSKLQCYLTLKREFTLANYPSTIQCPKLRKMFTTHRMSEHSLATEKGWHRQSWLPQQERLCCS